MAIHAVHYSGRKVVSLLILALILAQVMGRFAWRLEELALFLFGTLMACLHVRFLLIFVPFFVAAFSSILTRWIPTYKPAKDKFVLNALIMACVAAGIIHYFPTSWAAETRPSRSPFRWVRWII